MVVSHLSVHRYKWLLVVMLHVGHLTEHDLMALFENFVSMILYSCCFYMHTVPPVSAYVLN